MIDVKMMTGGETSVLDVLSELIERLYSRLIVLSISLSIDVRVLVILLLRPNERAFGRRLSCLELKGALSIREAIALCEQLRLVLRRLLSVEAIDKLLELAFGIGLFFFSSRRRHTRCSRDWSSDVCSSDLSELLWWLPPPWKFNFCSRFAYPEEPAERVARPTRKYGP